MEDKKNILVFCIGKQLFGTKPDESVIPEIAKKTGLKKSWIYFCMVLDMYITPKFSLFGGHSIIKDYKTGKINNNKQFCDGIRGRLWTTKTILSDENLIKCWNSMCKFDDSAKEKIKDLITFLLANPNVKIISLTDTNKLHYDYNMEQFNDCLDDYKKEGGLKLTDNEQKYILDQIIHINSHEKGVLGKDKLLEKAMEDEKVKKIDLKNTKIISLHRDIKPKGAIQVPTTPKTNLIKAVERVCPELQINQRKDGQNIKETSKQQVTPQQQLGTQPSQQI